MLLSSFRGASILTSTLYSLGLKTMSSMTVSDGPAIAETCSTATASASSSSTSTPTSGQHLDCVVRDEQNKFPEKTMSKRALKAIKRANQKEKYKEMRRKNKPPCRNTDPGFSDFSETEYYFENGLRKVYPYYYEFTSYVKGRWIGRRILEIFETEFLQYGPEHYERALVNGNLKVNHEKVSPDYVLKATDIITSRIHRHECPVNDVPLEIIEENDDLIVINKPTSIPVHPCGRFRYNSVYFILGKEHGLKNLRTGHRLDRMTSGVLVMPKNENSARKFLDAIGNREVIKEYVCRVIGEFPETEVEVDQPLGLLNIKLGLQRVRPDGKPSRTTFQRLSFNGKTSVVKCRLHTGRTHQIRVHLQYLGHPIVNDFVYNSDVFGPDRGKGGNFEVSGDVLYEKLKERHNIGLWEADEENPHFHKRIAELKADTKSYITQMGECDNMLSSGTIVNIDETGSDNVLNKEKNSKEQVRKNVKQEDIEEELSNLQTEFQPSSKKLKLDRTQNIASLEGNTSTTEGCGVSSTNHKPGFQLEKWIPDEDCIECRKVYIDPKPKDMTMYLHALRYKTVDWEYIARMPDWAKDDWIEQDEL